MRAWATAASIAEAMSGKQVAAADHFQFLSGGPQQEMTPEEQDDFFVEFALQFSGKDIEDNGGA